MTVLGFLGPCGTHSEEAALYIRTLLHKNWQLKPYHTIYAALLAVQNKQTDYCLVPVENSIEGSVRMTLDTLAHDVDLKIDMELIWQVHNQLLAKDKIAKITKVISHSQALAQCREYLKKNYPLAELIEVSSTAHAAEIAAAQGRDYAAIASNRSAQLYNLTIIDKNIEDNRDNVTRFIFLSRKTENIISEKPEKMMLICRMDGSKAGSLCDVLEEFAKYKINMTHIESRPTKSGLGNYMFFFEIEAAPERRENLQAALQAVKNKCFWLKEMGIFPVIKANK